MAQIRNFTSTNDSYFILDGVSYPKVYEAMLDSGYTQDRVKLVSTNRDTLPLVFSTHYSNIRVDGVSFASAQEAISRLNQVVFSKGGGSGGGGTFDGIVTEDTDTVSFTGNGKAGSPLKADNIDAYSLTETKTGKTWIDGKPIYRKVISFNGNNQSTININYNIPNLEYIVFYDAYIKTSSSIVKLPNTLGSVSSLEAYVTLSTGQIKVFWGEIISSVASFKFIIEYTKTTSE